MQTLFFQYFSGRLLNSCHIIAKLSRFDVALRSSHPPVWTYLWLEFHLQKRCLWTPTWLQRLLETSLTSSNALHIFPPGDSLFCWPDTSTVWSNMMSALIFCGQYCAAVATIATIVRFMRLNFYDTDPGHFGLHPPRHAGERWKTCFRTATCWYWCERTSIDGRK